MKHQLISVLKKFTHKLLTASHYFDIDKHEFWDVCMYVYKALCFSGEVSQFAPTFSIIGTQLMCPKLTAGYGLIAAI